MHKLLTIPALALAVVAIPAHAQRQGDGLAYANTAATIQSLEEAGDCVGAVMLRANNPEHGDAKSLYPLCVRARGVRLQAQLDDAKRHGPEAAARFLEVLKGMARSYTADAELRAAQISALVAAD